MDRNSEVWVIRLLVALVIVGISTTGLLGANFYLATKSKSDVERRLESLEADNLAQKQRAAEWARQKVAIDAMLKEFVEDAKRGIKSNAR